MTGSTHAASAVPPGLSDSAAPEGARITGRRRSDDDGPGPEVMAASSLEGESVINRHGETVGEIEEIMLDVASGRIAYAVLAVGGFLGIGEKYFAVPWRALELDAQRKCFVLDVDKERLSDAPGFDKEHWPSTADASWAAEVDRFYGGR